GLLDRVLEPQPGECLEAVVRYGTASVRRSVEERVMNHDDLAVPRKVQVELDRIDLEPRGVAEADEAVLGPQIARSAMPDDADHDAPCSSCGAAICHCRSTLSRTTVVRSARRRAEAPS